MSLFLKIVEDCAQNYACFIGIEFGLLKGEAVEYEVVVVKVK